MSEPCSDTLRLREALGKADIFGKTTLILASWFGAGLMPRAPGTFGTFTALPLALVIQHLGPVYAACLLVIVILLAIRTSALSQNLLGRDDPPEVVIDEVVGFSATLFLVPPSWLALSMGFVLFRVFDILKPFPIRRLEGVGGGLGIVLDDLMAGLYGNLCLRVAMHFIGGAT